MQNTCGGEYFTFTYACSANTVHVGILFCPVVRARINCNGRAISLVVINASVFMDHECDPFIRLIASTSKVER